MCIQRAYSEPSYNSSDHEYFRNYEGRYFPFIYPTPEAGMKYSDKLGIYVSTEEFTCSP